MNALDVKTQDMLGITTRGGEKMSGEYRGDVELGSCVKLNRLQKKAAGVLDRFLEGIRTRNNWSLSVAGSNND